MSRDKVISIIHDAIIEANVSLVNKIDLSEGESIILYAQESLLDSISLVNLIMHVERGIEEEFNRNLTLASEKAFSAKHSPFSTVGTLADYVMSEMELLHE
ncbi:MAG TPA: acyl carrier protein [Patescibacteria group bacterium]|nr:acyl carrier protein [Gammaproteobacteria bacterium]HWA51475.1 acyl carrier protein [Patescibacteria group bacterium]